MINKVTRALTALANDERGRMVCHVLVFHELQQNVQGCVPCSVGYIIYRPKFGYGIYTSIKAGFLSVSTLANHIGLFGTALNILPGHTGMFDTQFGVASYVNQKSSISRYTLRVEDTISEN